ncbi:unnamed protein product [Acanthoscelides obtectus]|uniref:Gustatory receptor n=1 Tax=Acanthoscelides obtectus TaxID=200917 RepID=A0A9P0K3Q4_ACAOB|nr:unnamed protein product [Acanthoscelides obtectus]CAK1629674.1 Gustatory receptor for sugar taste 64f [Acanthoscelides obtectus]
MANYEISYDLRKKVHRITICLMLTAAVEHGLVNAHKLKAWIEETEDINEAFKQYFVSGYPHIFGAVEYSFSLGLLVQLTNLQRTFLWSYADVFVMLVGSAVTFRVNQFCRKVQTLSQKQINDKQAWQSVRNDYSKLFKLCQTTNRHLSNTIIVSFLFNLYFILIQLFSSLKQTADVVKKAYFLLSVLFISIRIACICVFGGNVYEEWANIGCYLNSIPSEAYNAEAERLIQYVLTCPLSLTGNHFFYITRSLMLKVS